MSDMSTAGQNMFTQQHQAWITQMMQACAMHNLAIKLPVAYMAQLRFQQVSVSSSHKQGVLTLIMLWYHDDVHTQKLMTYCADHNQPQHLMQRPVVQRNNYQRCC